MSDEPHAPRDNAARNAEILRRRPALSIRHGTRDAEARRVAREMHAEGWKDVTWGVVIGVWGRQEAAERRDVNGYIPNANLPRGDAYRPKFSTPADPPDVAALKARNALHGSAR